MNVKLEDITKKYPFIYEVKDDFYIIGCGAFAPCKSQFAISYYQNYREAINKLGRDFIQEHHYDYPEDFDALVYNFRKVKAYADIGIPNEDRAMAGRIIPEFLESLDEKEKEKLLHQVEDYVASFWYYNRNF